MSPRKSTLAALAAIAAFSVHATTASAAGLKRLEVPAATGRPALAGAVWYPCASPAGRVRLRRIEVPGVKDCPVKGTHLPLVVISHGFSGWFGGHHDTAAALADAGFVVAAITHTGEYARSWRYTRPAAIQHLIDYMIKRWPDRARIDKNRVGFFGFSRGGYTGLVLIGGVPDFRRIVTHCRKVPKDPVCRPTGSRARQGRRTSAAPKPSYVHDARIKAAVIAAPLGVVFGRHELKDIRAPVQLWRAAKDERARFPYHADAVAKALPVKPDYRVVSAGHFAFLAPCTARQAQVAPALCRDADGFDRVGFHKRLNAEIVAFLRKHLR
ncbi:MAG: dienelactone hydrolase [Alphaproteobacteria bacterium]|nr:dienelactone hydrolase [Alphaproteobacteria bacterium]